MNRIIYRLLSLLDLSHLWDRDHPLNVQLREAEAQLKQSQEKLKALVAARLERENSKIGIYGESMEIYNNTRTGE